MDVGLDVGLGVGLGAGLSTGDGLGAADGDGSGDSETSGDGDGSGDGVGVGTSATGAGVGDGVEAGRCARLEGVGVGYAATRVKPPPQDPTKMHAAVMAAPRRSPRRLAKRRAAGVASRTERLTRTNTEPRVPSAVGLPLLCCPIKTIRPVTQTSRTSTARPAKTQLPRRQIFGQLEAPEEFEGLFATHPASVHFHAPSAEMADSHCAPSQYHRPSSENFVMRQVAGFKHWNCY